MPKDLRSFLEEIRRIDPKQLIEVGKEVSCRYEVIAVSELLEQRGQFPMVLYHNVRNLKEVPGGRVLVNLYGDRRRYPIALGLPREQRRMEPILAYVRGMEKPIPPVVVDPREAPAKEIVTAGKGLDLRQLPVVHHHVEDGGPYITQPVLSKNPETGVYNLSFHRTMILSENEVGMMIGPAHTFDNMVRYKAIGRDCPIAYVIGHHPLLGWAANTKAPHDYDEIALTGGLLREPVRMVASETWGSDFLVPADAEIVIEAEVVQDKTVKEGPFGEWTGFIGASKERNYARVRAITRRRDPILVTEPMGVCGLYGLSALPYESQCFRMARQIYPHVKAIHFARSGNGFTTCYLSIRKNSPMSEGEQKNVAMHLCFGRTKLIVVVDEDVDVYNEEEVMRAVALRCQASLDVDIVRGIKGSPLDPSLVHPTTHDVMIIDATWKLDRRIPLRSSLPAEVLKGVHIEDYIRQE